MKPIRAHNPIQYSQWFGDLEQLVQGKGYRFITREVYDMNWTMKNVLMTTGHYIKSICTQLLVILTGCTTIFLASHSLWADAYWVSSTGAASWANARSDTPLSGAACASLATANQYASSGNTVYLRGGIYPYATQYGSHLAPKGVGTPSAWIVFKNAPGEQVELIGTYGVRMWGLMVQNVSYIQLDGLMFSDYSDYLVRAGAHHIEIKNCTFQNMTSPYRGGGLFLVESCVGGSSSNCPVSHIWVHHCTFYKMAAGGGCKGGLISEGGDMLRIGYPPRVDPSPTGDNSHITIENNYMAYAGHAVMDSYGQYCVFKNNRAHNEPWYPADNGSCHVNHEPVYENAAYNGLYGHRVWQITDDYQRDGVFNLLEGNRLGCGGVNPNNNGAESLAIASSRNIVRYNAFFGSMNYGIMPKYGSSGASSIGGLNNRIYNNTIYKHGYGYPYYQTCTNDQESTCPQPMYGINFYYPSDNKGNIIINNIVYGNYQAVGRGGPDIRPSTGNTVDNNWVTTDGDPLFENPDLTQPNSSLLPDLRLKTGSGAINRAVHLTTVTAVAGPVNITVTDPLFFQDGTWGAEMTHGVTLFPDWIAVGTVTNVIQIRSIDYSTGVIELNSSPHLPIHVGDKIWLYRTSNGDVVMAGDSPDVGAYEYASTEPFLQVTSPNGSEIWRRGESRDITWTATEVTGNLTIELLQNDTVLGTIVSAVDAASGSYSWTVGRLENGSFVRGPGLKIRIRTTSGLVLAEKEVL